MSTPEAGDFPCSVKRPYVIFAVTEPCTVISGETTIMFVAITGMFLETTIMFVVTAVLLYLASRMCRARSLLLRYATAIAS